jgi:hypothetical protein
MKPANLGEDNVTLAVNHHERRYSPDAEARCRFSPHRAPHVSDDLISLGLLRSSIKAVTITAKNARINQLSCTQAGICVSSTK